MLATSTVQPFFIYCAVFVGIDYITHILVILCFVFGLNDVWTSPLINEFYCF